MADNKLESSIIPTLRAAHEHDWQVLNLDQPDDLGVDGYTLQIRRGRFLLEVITAEGLTDMVTLTYPKLDQFIRLADCDELCELATRSDSDIEAIWHRRSNDWRGPKGEPVLNEFGKG